MDMSTNAATADPTANVDSTANVDDSTATVDPTANVDSTATSQTLPDFVHNLLTNPDARAAYELDPQGTLHNAGLEDLTPADMQDAIPLVGDYFSVQAITSLTPAGEALGLGLGTVNGVTSLTGDVGGTLDGVTSLDLGGTVSGVTSLTGDLGGTVSGVSGVTGGLGVHGDAHVSPSDGVLGLTDGLL